MLQSHAAKLDYAFDCLSKAQDYNKKAMDTLVNLRQKEEEEYLERTDHICKCKGCENHDE